jgi:hypothetical protein
MDNLRGLLLITILIISCESNNDSDSKEKINFNGITTTDDFGIILTGDPTDWKLNDVWNLKERSLFAEKRNSTCTSNIVDYSIIAFPNPCADIINLDLNFPTGFAITLRIVDRYYNSLLSLDNNTSKELSIRVSDFNIANDTIRIYYKFLGTDCELNGHGDIKIK